MSVTHYSLEEWSDFARDRASAVSAARMRRHLDEGCAACAQVLRMWRSVLRDPDIEWRCGVPSGRNNPSLMLGYAGIVYAMLRANDPSAVPSLLVIEDSGRAYAGKANCG